MNYDFLTDEELLRLVHSDHLGGDLVRSLAERLEMRLREIKDLQDEVQRLEDELC